MIGTNSGTNEAPWSSFFSSGGAKDFFFEWTSSEDTWILPIVAAESATVEMRRHRFRQGQEEATAVCYGREGRWLVLGTKSGWIDLWDAASGGHLVQIASLESPIATVAANERASLVVGATTEGQIAVLPADPLRLPAGRVLDWANARTGITMQDGGLHGLSREQWETARAESVASLTRDVADGQGDDRARVDLAAGLVDIAPEDSAALRVLIAALGSEDPEAVDTSWNALAGIEPGAVAFREQVLELVNSGKFGREQALLLTELGPEALASIERLLADESFLKAPTRAELAFSLRRIGRDAVPALARAVGSADPRVRVAGANAIEAIGPEAEDAAGALVVALGADDRESREAIEQALVRIGHAALPKVLEALRTSDGRQGVVLIDILEDLEWGEAAPEAITALGVAVVSNDPSLRLAAAKILAAHGEEAAPAAGPLVECLGMDDQPARLAAGEALEEIGPAAIPDLLAGLKSPVPIRRSNAIVVLKSCSSDPLFKSYSRGATDDEQREVFDALARVALHDEDEAIRADDAFALSPLHRSTTTSSQRRQREPDSKCRRTNDQRSRPARPLAPVEYFMDGSVQQPVLGRPSRVLPNVFKHPPFGGQFCCSPEILSIALRAAVLTLSSVSEVALINAGNAGDA